MKMRQSLKAAFAASLLALAVSGCASMDGMAGASGDSRSALAAAIAAPTRTPANVARDRYRNPAETLAFFGVRPTDTLVEVAPGGGWYTEILAPFVAERGRYYAVASTGGLNGVRKMMETNPSLYGKANLALFPAKPGETSRVPDGSADVVLTFRNVHNWMMAKEPFADEAFRQMYAMLKPGGTLGVVEHRLPESAEDARQLTSGYVKTSTVRRMAEQAGFRFVGASEVNANPRDTKDYADGVWTLPPTLRLKDKDREKYLAIGESDRMTLKFVKPR
jgi:predicted methyltransferase